MVRVKLMMLRGAVNKGIILFKLMKMRFFPLSLPLRMAIVLA